MIKYVVRDTIQESEEDRMVTYRTDEITKRTENMSKRPISRDKNSNIWARSVASTPILDHRLLVIVIMGPLIKNMVLMLGVHVPLHSSSSEFVIARNMGQLGAFRCTADVTYQTLHFCLTI